MTDQLVKDKIINELILCKNVKLQFVSKKVDDYNNTICWFKIIGKKNMIPILTIYNTNKELNDLLVKKDEELEKSISHSFLMKWIISY